MVRYFNILTMLLVSFIGALAIVTDTRTAIFHPDFSSLKISVDDDVLADPVISLDDARRLVIEFDERASDVRYMRYSLTHCNADWTPSALIPVEYLDGFNEGTVDVGDFSRATTVQYVHYRIVLPNEQIRITRSGNYLLQVFDETAPDNILLQARFRVSEQRVSIDAVVSSRTDIDYNRSHQQLSIFVDAGEIPVNDAFNDFKLTVSQNNRTDNVRLLRHPLRLQGQNLVYEHMPELIFPAGNEYRRFETVSTRIPSMHVAEVGFSRPYYYAILETDLPRLYEPYSYDSTQQGQFLIREQESTDSDTEADYVITYFYLAMPEATGLDIYVEGDITNRRLDDTSRMRYNPEIQAYEKAMLLKQGSYNYQYLAVPQGLSSGLTSTVEGDFYNTANRYQIAVYHRLPSERADRLLGYSTITFE